MSLTKLIIVGAAIAIIASIIIISAMSYMTKTRHLPEDVKLQKYNKRFRFYYDFALTRSMFRRMYEQIASLAVYNFLECRAITVQFFERAMFSAGLLFIIGFIGLGDIISGVVLLMFAVVMINTIVNKRIDDINFKALKDMSSLILSIRECYTRVRNVPDAINDATCSPLLKRNVNDIYLICTAIDAEDRLEAFYKECPNRIMRTLATTCYIRSDVGDEGITGESPFKQALGLIKDEVDMEVRRQINQRIMFKTLDKLPFVPLFLYPPVKMFYIKMFSATASVFESGIGYMIKLAVVLASFICYYVLSTMNNASVARTDDRLLFIQKLLYNTKVRKFAKTLVIKKYEVRLRKEAKLKGCLSSKDIEYLYLEKFIFAVVAFIVSILASILIILYARNATYNSLSSDTMSVSLTYTSEQERQTRAYDSEVLAMDVLPDEYDMRAKFESIFPKYTNTELDAQVDRLTSKYTCYHNLHYNWWYSLLYIAASIVGWFIPEFLLHLRASLVKSEAEIDILQLQTVIAILMDTPLDTLSVLYWLAKSSDIHKDILTYAYHSYVRDAHMALSELKSKSVSAEFSAMCDKLITTIHQVTLAEAFEDLIGERQNMMKIRELVQNDALRSKRNIASPISTAPMVVWMGAVFILPLVIVAVRSAVFMVSNLNL